MNFFVARFRFDRFPLEPVLVFGEVVRGVWIVGVGMLEGIIKMKHGENLNIEYEYKILNRD